MKLNKLLSLVLAFVICFAAPLTVNPLKAFAEDATTPVAKVGNTEYATIDEAIANWTNNTTLTLLADVTLSSTIDLSSTEHHILDLGTFTMSYPGKTAINIVNNGRSKASYALDIKADATNPGRITANTIVNTKGKSGVQDRPIIRFYNGVFTGSYVVKHSGSNGTKCPQFWFYGGEFNGSISTNRALIQFHGGTFNGSMSCSVDSSAYMLVSGGRFKELSNSYSSALTSAKFTIGSAKGVYDRYIYVDAEGYINVAAQLPENIANEAIAVVNEDFTTSDYDMVTSVKEGEVGQPDSYFSYSSVRNGGDFYYCNLATLLSHNGDTFKKISVSAGMNIKFLKTSAEPITVKSGKTLKCNLTNGGVVPANVINLESLSSKLVATFAEGNDAVVDAIKVKGCSELYDVKYTESTKNGIVTRTYTQAKIPGEANIGRIEYATLESALEKAVDGNTIILNKEVELNGLTIDKNITLDLGGKTLTLNKARTRALADFTLAKGNNITIKNGNLVGKEDEDILVQNLANLTLENVTLENLTLNVTNDQGDVLLTLAEGAEIIDSTILAGEKGVAFNVKGNASVSNVEVQGLIKLTSGKLTALDSEGNIQSHNLAGNYIQLEETAEIVRLDDYKFDIDVNKTALKTGEKLTATISLDKDFYSTEFTFTYDATLFKCAQDENGDGIIYSTPLFSKEGANKAALVTYELEALNNIEKVEKEAKLSVTGNVIQYKEQAINQYVNETKGAEATIKISLNYTVEIVHDYVPGASLILVKGADGGYSLDGNKMFFVEAYDAYAYVVAGGIDPAGVDAIIAKASDCETIKPSYDVNCEFVADGKVDLKDATIAYACSYMQFLVADYVELYLRADVNGDRCVNIVDISEITQAYVSL